MEPPDCTLEVNSGTIFCVNQAQEAADIAFAISIATNVILFLVFIFVYLLLRRSAKLRIVYENRTDFPAPARTCFGWLIAAWNADEDEIMRKRGLDIVMYFKFLKYCFFICTAYVLYGIILFITHALSGGPLVGTAKISMSNVPLNSAFYAADIIGVYFNSIIAFIGCYRLYQEYTRLRIQYRRNRSYVENFTVLVREIESTTSEETIFEKFDAMFPGKVAFVRKAYYSKSMVRHLNLRQKMGEKLEKFNGVLKKKGERKMATDKPPLYCLCGNKVDGIELFEQRYEEECAICERKAAKMEADPEKYGTGVAFVTFKDIASAQLAAQSQLFEGHLGNNPLAKSWVVDYAPSPLGVQWLALRIGHMSRFIRCIFVNIATAALIFLWTIPVVFASGLSNMQTLATLLPFLIPILDLVPVIKGFIEGFLPGLVIIIFFAILVKFIITPLAKAEGQYSIGTVRRSVFNKYFLFCVVNIFLASVFASSFFQVIGEIAENPAIIPTLLPSQAPYFVSYIMILSLSGMALSLIHPGSIIKLLLKPLLGSTKRKARALEGPFHAGESLAPAYSRHVLIFLLCTVYSTLNPLIIPFAMIYFALAYITNRYNFIYVFTVEPRDQGSLFPAIFTRMCWSIVIFQVVIAAIMGLGGFPWAAFIVIPIIAVLALWLWGDRQLHARSKFGVVDRDESESDSFFDGFDKQISDHAFPHGDTYKFPHLRQPLFVVQDQHNDQEYEPRGWWPVKYVESHIDFSPDGSPSTTRLMNKS